MFTKKIIFYSILFALLYFELEEIGGMKFAILWKGFLLVLVIGSLALRSGLHSLSKLVFWGLLFSAESALNMSLFIDPGANISELVKNAYIPVFFAALHPGINKSVTEAKIYRFTIDTAYFIVLSSVPFLLGILEPRGQGYDLSIFGQAGEGFVGIFQTSHAASITLGFALIILFDHFRRTDSWGKKAALVPIVLIGIVSLYLTYTRTGYFIFLFGLTGYLLLNRSSYRFLWVVVEIGCVLTIGLYLFATSDVFEMRILGINQYMINGGSADTGIDSGRWGFWVAAVGYFTSQDFLSQLIGLGSSLSMDLMYEVIGLRVYAHNGFINILQYNGYIGVVLYCLFLTYLVKEIFRFPASRYFPLMFALLMCYIAQMLVQGERIFLADLLFVGGLLMGHSNNFLSPSSVGQKGVRSALNESL